MNNPDVNEHLADVLGCLAAAEYNFRHARPLMAFMHVRHANEAAQRLEEALREVED